MNRSVARLDEEETAARRHAEFTDRNGEPVFMHSSLGVPPWGSLTAVDLSEVRIKWSVPLGNLARFIGYRRCSLIPDGVCQTRAAQSSLPADWSLSAPQWIHPSAP